MRRINAICFCAWAAASLAHADRRGSVGNGFVTSDGLTIRYEMVLEPPLKHSDVFLLGSGVKPDGSGMHRFIVDGTSHSYFGYDLAVRPDGPNRHLVTFGPLHVTDKDLLFVGSKVPLTPAVLPRYPAPQVVPDGDIIAIDLLVSPNGQQRLVDYIRIEGKAARDASANPAPVRDFTPSRDFTLDDGPLNFDVLMPPRVWMNGQEFRDPIGQHIEAGSTMWLALPGRGTYILSLAPQPQYRFQKAGFVRDGAIDFQMDGDQIEIKTSGPLAGAGRVWNLYVLHQASRETTGAAFGVGRLENLIR